jgi:hypothetical protein
MPPLATTSQKAPVCHAAQAVPRVRLTEKYEHFARTPPPCAARQVENAQSSIQNSQDAAKREIAPHWVVVRAKNVHPRTRVDGPSDLCAFVHKSPETTSSGRGCVAVQIGGGVLVWQPLRVVARETIVHVTEFVAFAKSTSRTHRRNITLALLGRDVAKK